MSKAPFRFKEFSVWQDRCAMKVGTDGVLLGAWTGRGNWTRILDIGCGTGLLALMQAQMNPQAQIIGMELEPEAWRQAASNMAASPWGDRLEAIQADVRAYNVKAEDKFDLLLCNPPYFSAGILPEMAARRQARHTVSLSQFELLTAVLRLMTKAGTFSVILPAGIASGFCTAARNAGLFPYRKASIRSRPQNPIMRYLFLFSREDRGNCPLAELSIHAENGKPYSEEFRELTQDFYLWLK